MYAEQIKVDTKVDDGTLRKSSLVHGQVQARIKGENDSHRHCTSYINKREMCHVLFVKFANKINSNSY